jgi:phage terminase Nu1 subunit (DNA packaging protein)
MPSRADNIFARYARAVSAQENIERALQQFAADEERANALEVLAANERANLAATKKSVQPLRQAVRQEHHATSRQANGHNLSSQARHKVMTHCLPLQVTQA